MTEVAVGGTGHHLAVDGTKFFDAITKCNDFGWADERAEKEMASISTVTIQPSVKTSHNQTVLESNQLVK